MIVLGLELKRENVQFERNALTNQEEENLNHHEILLTKR